MLEGKRWEGKEKIGTDGLGYRIRRADPGPVSDPGSVTRAPSRSPLKTVAKPLPVHLSPLSLHTSQKPDVSLHPLVRGSPNACPSQSGVSDESLGLLDWFQNWPSPTHNAENLLYYPPLHFTISTELSFEFLEDLFATASPSVNTVSVNSVIIRTLRPGIPRSHGGNSARHRTRRCRRQIGGPADTGGRPAGR